MVLHKCYLRLKPQRQRYQSQDIDIHAKMPDIEKIKINIGTAVTAIGSIVVAVFLAGGWFQGVKNIEKRLDMYDASRRDEAMALRAILDKLVDHDARSDERIYKLERRVDVIENIDGIRASRGIKPTDK